MVAPQPVRDEVRPVCPRHPGSRVRLDGYVHCAWSEAYRRPRYRFGLAMTPFALGLGGGFALPLLLGPVPLRATLVLAGRRDLR